jgi:hypothetical protein
MAGIPFSSRNTSESRADSFNEPRDRRLLPPKQPHRLVVSKDSTRPLHGIASTSHRALHPPRRRGQEFRPLWLAGCAVINPYLGPAAALRLTYHPLTRVYRRLQKRHMSLFDPSKLEPVAQSATKSCAYAPVPACARLPLFGTAGRGRIGLRGA